MRGGGGGGKRGPAREGYVGWSPRRGSGEATRSPKMFEEIEYSLCPISLKVDDVASGNTIGKFSYLLGFDFFGSCNR